MENGNIIIYKSTSGIEIQVKLNNDTIWLDAHIMATLFDVNRPAIVKHIQNIYKSNELEEVSTCSKMEQVASDGKKRMMNLYNLDVVLSVGYRVNSKQATLFRQWATQRLKDYLVQGYAINKSRLIENKVHFLQTLEDLKQVAQNNSLVETKEILSIIQAFSTTWFSLDSYDKNKFPKNGTQQEVVLSAQEFQNDLQQLKAQLIKKGEATELFAQEKKQGNIESIFSNVFQSVFREDAYKTIEEKAVHLLYFIIKWMIFNNKVK